MANVIPLPRSEAMTKPLRAALYGRASSDPKKRGRSINDQFTVGKLECADRGWTVTGYYEDRDRSASRRARKARENYERLISDMEAGLVDVVVYAERSRASRNLEVSLKLRDLCERTGVLLCYDGRVYDMRVTSDRREFTRDSVQSEEEAEATADRANRTVRLNARRGAPHSKVPFGYTRSYDPADGHLIGQVPHPERAEVVRELFLRADAKESLSSALLLLREHVPDAGRSSLRNLLRNPAYIGVRTHGSDRYKATWDAIIDDALYWRVQAALNDSSRGRSREEGVRHPLTGIALCEVCRAAGDFKEAGLRFRGPRPSQKTPPAYLCRLGHVGVQQKVFEAYVEEAVLGWLGSPAAWGAFRSGAAGGELERVQARVAAMKEQLAEARRQATEFSPVTGLPVLSVASLAAIEERVLPLIAEAEGEVQGLLSVGDPLMSGLLGLSADQLDAVWEDGLDMVQRRHVLRMVVRVGLKRAPRKGRYQSIDDRVVLLLPGDPGFEEWPVSAGVACQ